MTRRHLLSHLTRDEVSRRAPAATAVVPIGACEQHGHHLPLGTDHILIEHIAEAVAEADEVQVDIVITPSAAIGYSPHHVAVGPTLTAGIETMLAVMQDTCDGLVSSGFRRIFLLNGHGGNAELVIVGARAAAQRHGIPVAAGSYWQMAWSELTEAGAQDQGRLPGHAGAFETSLMLAVRPDLVAPLPRRPNPHPHLHERRAQFFGAYHAEDPGAFAALDGFSDNPADASADDGQRYFAAIVRQVAAGICEFARSGTQPQQDSA